MVNAKKAVLISLLWLAVAAVQGRAQNVFIEARSGFFFSSDPLLRNIYGSGLSWGGDAGFRVSQRFFIWGGTDYFSKTGSLPITKVESRIRLVPLIVGIRYDLMPGRWRPYIGGGVGYFQYTEKNEIGEIKEKVMGLVWRAGLLLKVAPGLCFDFHGLWKICRARQAADETSINLGGFQAGCGIALEF